MGHVSALRTLSANSLMDRAISRSPADDAELCAGAAEFNYLVGNAIRNAVYLR